MEGWISDHVGVSTVNPQVIAAMHDKGARLTIKQFHPENLAVSDSLPKLKFTNMTEGMADITVNWVEPQDVYAVMDAVFNYVMVEWRV